MRKTQQRARARGGCGWHSVANTVWRLDGAGVFAGLPRRVHDLPHTVNVRGWNAAISAALFVCVGVLVRAPPQTQGLLVKTIDAPLPGNGFAMAWAGLLIPFIAWNVRQPSGPVDRRLGDYSYSLYLVHFPVFLVLREAINAAGPGAKLLAIIASLIISGAL